MKVLSRKSYKSTPVGIMCVTRSLPHSQTILPLNQVKGIQKSDVASVWSGRIGISVEVSNNGLQMFTSPLLSWGLTDLSFLLLSAYRIGNNKEHIQPKSATQSRFGSNPIAGESLQHAAS